MKTLMDQNVEIEYMVQQEGEKYEGSAEVTMGEVVTNFAGVVFMTMPEVTKFKSKMFKDGVYRVAIMDDDGECSAFLKATVK